MGEVVDFRLRQMIGFMVVPVKGGWALQLIEINRCAFPFLQSAFLPNLK
jgi:hypothetical protein